MAPSVSSMQGPAPAPKSRGNGAADPGLASPRQAVLMLMGTGAELCCKHLGHLEGRGSGCPGGGRTEAGDGTLHAPCRGRPQQEDYPVPSFGFSGPEIYDKDLNSWTLLPEEGLTSEHRA